MNSELTLNYNIVKGLNEQAAEVYRDVLFYELDNKDIAKFRGIHEEKVKELLSTAKRILKLGSHAWLNEFSSRARAALIENKYTEYSELYADVMNEKIDLESYPGIGHKIATEIRRWCITHS